MIKTGKYLHYKGKEYEVIGTALHSETLEEMVVYRTLYKNEKSELWIRPVKMFTEKIEVNGKEIPRFTRVSD